MDLRRCELRPDEATPWSRISLASRRRTAFDLLLDRELPDTVADLDAALSAALVGRTENWVGCAARCLQAGPFPRSLPPNPVGIFRCARLSSDYAVNAAVRCPS
jgi:hypothetical protein